MNLNDALNTQHADYEADTYGLDDCPFDNTIVWHDDNDINVTRPCNQCGFTDCETCLDTDSPYGHIAARRGW